MTAAKSLALQGGIIVGAGCGCGPIPAGACPIPLNAVIASYQASTGLTQRQIASPAAFVDLLAGSGLTQVMFVYLRVIGGTVTLRVTTAAGVDQVSSVSDLYVVSHSSVAAAFTAVAVQGTAEIEFLAVGS